MKTPIPLVSLLLTALVTQAQTPAESPAGPEVSSGVVLDYSVAERAHNSRIWQRVIGVTNSLGRVRFETNSFTELESGMAYVDPDSGALVDSVPDFQVSPDGHAVALTCQHQLIVSPSLTDPNGVLDAQMPDGQRLRCAVRGLVVSSPATGKSLQICAVKDCDGGQTAPNEVVFPDAFDGMLKASLRIRNEKGQFHQDVLLQENFSKAQLESWPPSGSARTCVSRCGLSSSSAGPGSPVRAGPERD